MPKFNEQLVGRTREYFSKRYGLNLSVEETNEILQTLAEGYEQFAVIAQAADAALKRRDDASTK